MLRKQPAIGSLISLILFVQAIPTLAQEPTEPTNSKTEFFSVEVGPLVADFTSANVISERPLPQNVFYQMVASPQIAVPTGVEAYLLTPQQPEADFVEHQIVGQKPIGQSFDGSFFTLQRDLVEKRETVLAKFDFHVDGQNFTPATSEDFYLAKGRHFERLWSEENAGAAMFRHIATQTLDKIDETARSTGPNWPLRNPLSGESSGESTLELTSGGRAVSENLQLYNQLDAPNTRSKELEPISKIAGIRIRPVDWKALLKDEPTELDPLSEYIPADQYAIFCRSFDSLISLFEQGSQLSSPLVDLFEMQSRRFEVLEFYQRQLAIPLDQLRQKDHALVDEMAVTGSDPYFRTGTDVAILLRSSQPASLIELLSAEAKSLSDNHSNPTRFEYAFGDYTISGWQTFDRRLSIFMANIGNTVIVSNSQHQLQRMLACVEPDAATMKGLDEYRFFRQRYQRTKNAEIAFLVVTDAAIRRWCGPQWRIAASRRTRARATIADVTARNADALVNGQITEPKEVPAGHYSPDAGQLVIDPSGVFSKTYGTLAFQTPIAELDIQTATLGEFQAYIRWRNLYQRRWQKFDPIAIQVLRNDEQLKLDISVIPLILQSDYESYRELVGDVRLKPSAFDLHSEAMVSWTVAIDTESSQATFVKNLLRARDSVVDPLGWIAGAVTVYFDRDEAWLDRFQQRSPWLVNTLGLSKEMPIGVFIPSKDNFQLATCLMFAQAKLESFFPNLLTWEPATYKGCGYVVATMPTNYFGNDDSSLTRKLYYLTTPRGLTMSLNEAVIQRAIERQLLEPMDVDIDPLMQAEPAPQIRLKLTGEGSNIISQLFDSRSRQRVDRLSWSNIPILNYLKHRYPEYDPADIYQKLFQETLVEPTGGEYVWSTDKQSYVSSTQGYPLAPEPGPITDDSLSPNDVIEGTLSFQDGGIRCVVTFQKDL